MAITGPRCRSHSCYTVEPAVHMVQATPLALNKRQLVLCPVLLSSGGSGGPGGSGLTSYALDGVTTVLA